MAEYADDITVYCGGSSFNKVKANVQDQRNKLYEWTQIWCLTINLLMKLKQCYSQIKNLTNQLIYLLTMNQLNMYIF